MKRVVSSFIHRALAHFRLRLIRPSNALIRHPAGELDLDLATLLESFSYREGRAPRVLQIGANDGVDNDPLHAVLRRYDWPALLVEPQPEIFGRLKATYIDRGNVRFANCAIGRSDGSADLYLLHPDFHSLYPHRADGLASFSRDHILRHIPARLRTSQAFTSIPVEVRSFDTLLREHSVSQVDALVVDTEGFDWEILQLFDIPTRRPSIIQYEWHNLPWSVVEDSLQYLISQGYRVRLLKSDVLAYRQNSPD